MCIFLICSLSPIYTLDNLSVLNALAPFCPLSIVCPAPNLSEIGIKDIENSPKHLSQFFVSLLPRIHFDDGCFPQCRGFSAHNIIEKEYSNPSGRQAN
jgi:hypothetical protein